MFDWSEKKGDKSGKSQGILICCVSGNPDHAAAASFHRILGNFVKFLANLRNYSSIKLQIRNHSYLVWRVPRGLSFSFVHDKSLLQIFFI